MTEEPENERPSAEEPVDRREFLKKTVLGAVGVKHAIAGGSVLGTAGIGAYAVHKAKGTPQDGFPVPIADDFKPVDQRRTLFTFAESRALQAKYPGRSEKFDGFAYYDEAIKFAERAMPPKDEVGYTQVDRALEVAGIYADKAMSVGEQNMRPNTGVCSWDQSTVAKTKHKFESKEAASGAIKAAARLFGASRCGITANDKRWDYDPLYDAIEEREISWDEFPFEPKSVIVLLVEMDYDCLKSSPAWTSMGASMEGYSMATKVVGQVGEFIRQLGYGAVAAGNDLGLSVPYAVAAGLGEAARNGTMIAPKLGPRHRIAKVYTDMELVEYDSPRTFGVQSFCENCKRCADSCPSDAITHGAPTWGPEYEGADDPDLNFLSNPGVLKFHNDSKRCFRFWCENGGGCSNCITACPYNKPEFWHHAFTDSLNVIMPGPAHAFMREMDIVFGYGTVFDEGDVHAFWKSGKDMRGG